MIVLASRGKLIKSTPLPVEAKCIGTLLCHQDAAKAGVPGFVVAGPGGRPVDGACAQQRIPDVVRDAPEARGLSAVMGRSRTARCLARRLCRRWAAGRR